MEATISEFFEEPNSTKYQPQVWDSTLHSADREGHFDGSSSSFRIQSADEMPLGSQNHLQYSVPASRAPSRLPSPHPSFGPINEQEHTDIDKAIAASLDPYQQQESGVTPSRTVFGPAVRQDYEEQKWALVLSPESSVRQPEPDPAYRKRDLGVPAFLIGSGAHCIGPLLTIYHEIPLLREVFLDRKNILANYGSSNEWWTGKAINIPRMDQENPDNGSQADKEFKYEFQRLMSFLDKTDRSYGSVDALVNSAAVRTAQGSSGNGLENATLNLYNRLLSDNPVQAQKLFSRPFNGSEEGPSSAIFDLEFPNEDSTDETVYDLADATMWSLPSTDPSNSAYISHIAEVVSFRLTGWTINKKSGVIFPAVWYPDRYLESSKQAAWEMRSQKSPIKAKLKKISELENLLTGMREHAGRTFTVRDMFEVALQHENDQVVSNIPIENENLISFEEPQKTKNLSAQLSRLMESIERKVAALNEEKEKCRGKLRELSKLYTESSDDPHQPKLHRYTMRGVCTDMNTVYINRQAEPSLIDMDLGEDAANSNQDQWWRIHYACLDSNPVSVEVRELL